MKPSYYQLPNIKQSNSIESGKYGSKDQILTN